MMGHGNGGSLKGETPFYMDVRPSQFTLMNPLKVSLAFIR